MTEITQAHLLIIITALAPVMRDHKDGDIAHTNKPAQWNNTVCAKD